MTLAAFADLAEVIGALGVIAGLVFVGVQLRQNTKQLRRGESNAAVEQASGFRRAIMGDADLARLLIAGLTDGPLSAADELRLNLFFSDATYLTSQSWDRARNGFAEHDEFERAAAPQLAYLLTSRRGAAWWAASRQVYRSEFIQAVEAAIPSLTPSATAPQPAESAVAPPADAG